MTDMLGTKSWANELIQNYREGFSDAEVAAALNITIREFNTQLSDNPTFAKLVDFGRTLSTAFWEGLARKNVANKSFNSSLYGFYMKNKFGWSDKVETTNTNENTNTNLDELRQQVMSKINLLVKQNHPELAEAQRVLQPVVVKEDSE
jgi:hypothetical protein